MSSEGESSDQQSAASKVAESAASETTETQPKADDDQSDALMSTVSSVVFPTYKPRDISYGLKSGIYNIGSGCVAGVTALVTAPIVGAKTGGMKGFAQGLGAGLVMGVALPLTGVVNGISQIGRGVANTYDSIEANMAGKVWDSEKECWIEYVPYNLNDEAAAVLNQNRKSSGGGESTATGASLNDGNKNPNKVKDMYYYDMLHVASDASAGQIKKGYYKEARGCHPDRHPNDPEAHAKFQELGEAYRILSSDQLRAYYDKYGREESKQGGPDAEMQMDMAKMFFAVMFGGEKFEPYIGQLGLTSVVDGITQEMQAHQMGQAAGKGLDFKAMKKTQLIREVQCAVNLARKLQPFVEGREEEFIANIKTEVLSLSKATFGEPLLHAIGESYLSGAEKYIGYKEGFLGIDGWIASMKQKNRSNMAYFDVASKGYASVSRMQRMAEISEKARVQDMEDPVPPTDEMVAAKEAAYNALSVKELRELCKERSRRPGSSSEADKGLDLSSCVEKKDIVRALLDNDALVFADIQNKHAAWKANGCEGPAPGRAHTRRASQANAAAAAAGKPAEGEEKSASEKEKDQDSMFGMGDDSMSPESQAQMAKEMESSLPVFLSALVSASLLDVEVTLKPVLKKVLNDHGVSEADRLKRAKGLLLIGAAFVAAKGANKGARGEVDAKHVLEGTMMKTMAKAQGQEVDDDDDYMAMREDLEKNQKEYEEEFGEQEDGDEGDSSVAPPKVTEPAPTPTTVKEETTTSPLFSNEAKPTEAASRGVPEDDLD